MEGIYYTEQDWKQLTGNSSRELFKSQRLLLLIGSEGVCVAVTVLTRDFVTHRVQV